MKEDLRDIIEALEKGQANKVKMLTEFALENGLKPSQILDHALLLGMHAVSEKFRNNKIYISDIIIISRAMHAGLHVLRPYLSDARHSYRGKVVIGTVAGDLHDIGKNIIIMMLQSMGLDVIDLGVDVYPEDFANAMIEHRPDMLAMSAMLTTTLNEVAVTIKELEKRKLRSNVKIIIGGGPVTENFRVAVGADAFAYDASEVLDVVSDLLS
ncbi:cobalamin-dependent protein [Bacillota bacterium LX-D]|nr:cobalamin-dependent protein [Bacillota bacterium LX-D]